MTKEEIASYILWLEDAQEKCDVEIDCIDFSQSLGGPSQDREKQTATNIKQLIQDKIDMMEGK